MQIYQLYFKNGTYTNLPFTELVMGPSLPVLSALIGSSSTSSSGRSVLSDGAAFYGRA